MDVNNVYYPGSYQLEANQAFFRFKTTQQKIEFSDEDFVVAAPIFANDGNQEELKISLVVTYKLQSFNIGQLYSKYKLNYEHYFS